VSRTAVTTADDRAAQDLLRLHDVIEDYLQGSIATS
jgi:hypothetical protein